MLPEMWTPRELFTFAAKLRTTIKNKDIPDHIESVARRLGLHKCLDTRVGGIMSEGLTKSERKRVSIGYEIIPEPPLLLLDEPTSGLDAMTSLRIAELMRREADSGKACLATIHQPQSKIFFLFSTISLSSLNGGIPKVKRPPILEYLSKTVAFTPFLVRISAQARPAGPAPITATLLSV